MFAKDFEETQMQHPKELKRTMMILKWQQIFSADP